VFPSLFFKEVTTVINQVMGFISSQRQQLKGWELPVAGLLLTAGLAVTVATVKTTASQHKEQAVNSIATAPTLETAVPQQQEQPVESAMSPSNVTTEPQQQEQAVEPPVTPPVMTTELQPQEEPAESAVNPYSLTAEPQEQEPEVDLPVVSSTRKATVSQPNKRKQAVEFPASPSTVTGTVPQPNQQAVESLTDTKPSIKWTRKAQESPRKPSLAQVPNSDGAIADGTYLYGQSAQAGEIGKEYIVFEARQGKIVGAMYMPSSEYACFYGTLNSKQMNLTVVNPHNQTSFAHTIARNQPTQIAAVGGQINLNNTYDSLTYPHSIGLEGYLPISQVSDNDKQILSNCLNKYQAQVWNY
jgi:outer membrane biosynthesis protein TonB